MEFLKYRDMTTPPGSSTTTSPSPYRWRRRKEGVTSDTGKVVHYYIWISINVLDTYQK